MVPDAYNNGPGAGQKQFVPATGGPAQGSRPCPHCGQPIGMNAQFCRHCGQSTQVQPVAQPVAYQANNGQKAATPTFQPLAKGMGPTPTFQPPARDNYYGASCHYHPNEPAVGRCSKCGKPLCEDCCDAYTLYSPDSNITDYNNQTLCYDCSQALVAENLAVLKQQKTKIIALMVATAIGLLFGASIGASSGSFFWTCVIALWCGSLWFWVKNTVISTKDAPPPPSYLRTFSSRIAYRIGSFAGAAIFSFFLAPIKTIVKIVECIKYLIQTSNDIEGDQALIQTMSDYMEYTLVRSQNPGVDINTLLQQNNQLTNNSVAQMAMTQSEEQIEAQMRAGLMQINEHGELIRNFVV